MFLAISLFKNWSEHQIVLNQNEWEYERIDEVRLTFLVMRIVVMGEFTSVNSLVIKKFITSYSVYLKLQKYSI